MSSEQKTIVINPELFNSSNKKKIKSGENNNTTRKKEKKSKPIIPDSVPNSKTLRKQFIKKIKEKQAESEKQYKLIEKEKEKENEKINKDEKKILPNINSTFNDEFTKSLAYLTALSESREKEKLKKKLQQSEQKKMNFTLKKERKFENNNNIFSNNLSEVQLELPDSLKPAVSLHNNINIDNPNNLNTFNKSNSNQNNNSLISLPIINNNNFNSSNNNLTEINFQTKQKELKEPPPYGCLKGGNKPTFKQWSQHNRTLKFNHNIPHVNNNENSINNEKERLKIQDFKKSEELSDREKRLQILKDKYSIRPKIPNNNENENEENSKKMKKYNYTRTIKKTTTVRNFKLGKNPKRKSISVLIKNGSTRKKIKTEIAELKRKGLSEIKEYLRSRNLLKVGSEAPPDVLRQMYETSILTGEINNLSSETLVHNFLNS